MFNERVRERVTNLDPDVVLDLGHARMDEGLLPAMADLARSTNRPVAHAQHRPERNGHSLHFVAADGADDSASADEESHLGNGQFWIDWQVREI
jgi:hypothetical protein